MSYLRLRRTQKKSLTIHKRGCYGVMVVLSRGEDKKSTEESDEDADLQHLGRYLWGSTAESISWGSFTERVSLRLSFQVTSESRGLI